MLLFLLNGQAARHRLAAAPRLAPLASPIRALAISITLTGCITHLPVRTTDHLRIAWARDWDDAASRAQRENKPILMLLVAGQIDGLC